MGHSFQKKIGKRSGNCINFPTEALGIMYVKLLGTHFVKIWGWCAKMCHVLRPRFPTVLLNFPKKISFWDRSYLTVDAMFAPTYNNTSCSSWRALALPRRPCCCTGGEGLALGLTSHLRRLCGTRSLGGPPTH